MAWITPVTDRTLNDVLDAKRNQTGMLGKKGAMDYPDLNRIEDNYKYLIGLLNGAGYYNQFESRNVTETWKEPVKLPPDEHTLLLLHGENLSDSSNYKIQLTNSGVQVSSAQSKFGGKSLYFNGNSYFKINISDLKLDLNADYTLEWFDFPKEKKGYECAVLCMPNGNAGFMAYTPDAGGENIRVFGGNDTNWSYIPTSSNMGVYKGEVWTHRAICKSGNKLYAFENGVKKLELTISNAITMKESLYVGYRATSGSAGGFVGYLDEIRISDIARWTSDFTPPSSPYTVEGGNVIVEKSKTFTDWQKDNILFKTEVDRIRRNLNKLSQIYLKGLGLPILDFNDSLDYIEANRWEDIELETYNAFDRMKQSYKYCGTQTCGGGTL